MTMTCGNRNPTDFARRTVARIFLIAACALAVGSLIAWPAAAQDNADILYLKQKCDSAATSPLIKAYTQLVENVKKENASVSRDARAARRRLAVLFGKAYCRATENKVSGWGMSAYLHVRECARRSARVLTARRGQLGGGDPQARTIVEAKLKNWLLIYRTLNSARPIIEKCSEEPFVVEGLDPGLGSQQVKGPKKDDKKVARGKQDKKKEPTTLNDILDDHGGELSNMDGSNGWAIQHSEVLSYTGNKGSNPAGLYGVSLYVQDGGHLVYGRVHFPLPNGQKVFLECNVSHSGSGNRVTFQNKYVSGLFSTVSLEYEVIDRVENGAAVIRLKGGEVETYNDKVPLKESAGYKFKGKVRAQPMEISATRINVASATPCN